MIKRSLFKAGIFATLLASSAAFAQNPAQSIIVLDASGSMWGQIDGEAKITIARRVISDILRDFPEDQAIGLSAYGHNRKGDCSDIELIVPPATGNAAKIAQAVAEISPKGKTPLSDAVVNAAKQLRSEEEPATIVLISDGIETCDQDPCAIAAQLEQTGVEFTAHVVGFDISVPEESEQLACLANETGGKYMAASNAAELSTALETVTETLVAPLEELTEVVVADRSSKLVFTDKKPGKEIDFATPTSPMEVQVARLGKGAAHHWKVSLQPGLHQFVFDVERADDDFTFTSLDIDFLQENSIKATTTLRSNGNYIRQRVIKRLEIPAPMELVVALSDANTVLDYNFAVLPIEEYLPAPYMDRNVEMRPLTPGQKATKEISGFSYDQGEAWFKVNLDAADYEFVVEFEHKTGDASFNSGLAMIYGENGEVLQNKPLCTANGPHVIVTCAARLSLADERDFFIRLTAPNGDPYIAGLVINELD